MRRILSQPAASSPSHAWYTRQNSYNIPHLQTYAFTNLHDTFPFFQHSRRDAFILRHLHANDPSHLYAYASTTCKPTSFYAFTRSRLHTSMIIHNSAYNPSHLCVCMFSVANLQVSIHTHCDTSILTYAYKPPCLDAYQSTQLNKFPYFYESKPRHLHVHTRLYSSCLHIYKLHTATFSYLYGCAYTYTSTRLPSTSSAVLFS